MIYRHVVEHNGKITELFIDGDISWCSVHQMSPSLSGLKLYALQMVNPDAELIGYHAEGSDRIGCYELDIPL